MKAIIKSLLAITLVSYSANSFGATATTVIEVQSLAHFDELIAKNPNIVVEFYAPWCPYCQSVMDIYEQVAKRANSITFARVNRDILPSLFEKYDVTGMPTVYFFKNGEIRNTVVGVQTPEKFKNRIESASSQLLNMR